jgi:hypothetical protein
MTSRNHQDASQGARTGAPAAGTHSYLDGELTILVVRVGETSTAPDPVSAQQGAQEMLNLLSEQYEITKRLPPE